MQNFPRLILGVIFTIIILLAVAAAVPHGQGFELPAAVLQAAALQAAPTHTPRPTPTPVPLPPPPDPIGLNLMILFGANAVLVIVVAVLINRKPKSNPRT